MSRPRGPEDRESVQGRAKQISPQVWWAGRSEHHLAHHTCGVQLEVQVEVRLDHRDVLARRARRLRWQVITNWLVEQQAAAVGGDLAARRLT